MNKFIVGAFIILAGGLFGWYVFNTPTTRFETSTPSSAPIAASANVSYSDGGFVPAKITVKKGSAVTFTNQSTGAMWVASDVHPTHQLLPGFDQLKGEKKDASYTYTFMKVGSWTYHNHANPLMSGTVTVME